MRTFKSYVDTTISIGRFHLSLCVTSKKPYYTGYTFDNTSEYYDLQIDYSNVFFGVMWFKKGRK